MRSGDTLVVKDGVYLQQDVLTRFDVRPPSGTSGRYTIIRAEHPGQAIIDGGGTMSPISLDGPPGSPIRYIQFDGLVFRHQTGAGFYQVDHIKLTRCGFEDAADGNSHTVAFGRYSSYILVEDCYAWGSGRYKFSTYHADHVVFRRNVVRFDRANAGGEPIAGFAIYASVQVEVQNCISIDGDKSSFWQNVGEYSGSYSIPSTDGPSTNIAIRGSIALNVDMQFGTLTKNLDKITIDDSVGWHLREGGWLRDSGTYDHCTFGDFYGPGRQAANVGFQYSPGDDPVNALRMTNSVLTGIKGTALTNFATENFNVFSGNTADRSGTTKGAQSVTANPGLQYLLRADPGNAVLSGTASDGGNRGATILKKIGVTGTMWGEPGYDQVTTEDLWPFPNEDIIRQHMRTYSYQSSAGTLSGNRGFCADGQTLSKYIWGYLGATSPY